ncbi:hypothetical protein KW801_03730 [Candidatus Saccharibacteria bacterium]|nr:hypothetical protein [Candidatus Saccharibacteria bacterium]
MLALIFAKLNLFIFAAVGDACTLPGSGVRSFFGFPHWWKYLSGQVDPIGKCSPAFSFPSDTWAVGLAIIDMLLRLAGIVAVVSIIIAGIGYITAAGSADKITSSRKRIVNSLLGLAVVLAASAVVSFIGNSLK